MNIIGKWKISDVMIGVENHKIVWKPVEEVKKNNPGPESIFYDSIFEFSDDGKSRTLMPIPENVPKEEVDKMAAEGKVTLYDGMVLAEEVQWEMEDDRIFYDTNKESNLLKNNVPSSLELDFVNGKLHLLTFLLTKI